MTSDQQPVINDAQAERLVTDGGIWMSCDDCFDHLDEYIDMPAADDADWLPAMNFRIASSPRASNPDAPPPGVRRRGAGNLASGSVDRDGLRVDPRLVPVLARLDAVKIDGPFVSARKGTRWIGPVDLRSLESDARPRLAGDRDLRVLEVAVGNQLSKLPELAVHLASTCWRRTRWPTPVPEPCSITFVADRPGPHAEWCELTWRRPAA